MVEDSPTIRFGVFELDLETRELRKAGRKVAIQEQPLRVLVSLLERPGELVTRDELREKLWEADTFVDFDTALNKAVTKVREVLGDSPASPRFVETLPRRGYRFIGTLERRLSPPVPIEVESVIRAEPERRRVVPWWPLAFAAACLVAFGVWWRLHDAGTGLPSGKVVRLTNDAGLSDSPALSPDGKLVAYSSDRANEGEMDLYVKQVAGGEPIRLTFDGLRNTNPNFSPDGVKVVFESRRDGGGIYEIPAFGGQARLLASGGLTPTYSPDGSQVAYWVGTQSVALAIPGTGAVWVVPVAGGPPRRVAPNLTDARWPIWSPDGKRLLFSGYSSAKPYDPSAIDWWLADANGGDAVRTGMYDVLVQAGLQGQDSAGNWATTVPTGGLPPPGCWSSAKSVIFPADSGGDTRNLWETGISLATGKVSGAFKRVTAGSGTDVDPSCAPGGSLVFASTQIRRDIWSLPFDLDGGKSKGALEPNMASPARRLYPSLSGDGRYVAFASAQSGRFNVWLRELETGKESPVASSSLVQRFPAVNASGSRVAFSINENDKRFVYASTPGGVPEKLCEGCIRATDWSRDEKTLLVFVGSPYQVDALDVASHRQTVLLKHPRYGLLYGRFSPDNSWVSFTARVEPNRGWIMIAPVGRMDKPVPESAWIKIAEEGADDLANWSPDGTTLYFTSARDGHRCLWGQKIDARSHRPEGEAFAAEHFHGRASFEGSGWSAGGGRVVIALAEGTGSIWMMPRSGAR
jgi:Tol biopolymer transport system component/DNA-binding winged helix-turn-helix (wHTH) protein